MIKFVKGSSDGEPGSPILGLNMTQIAHEWLVHDNSLIEIPYHNFNFFLANVRLA